MARSGGIKRRDWGDLKGRDKRSGREPDRSITGTTFIPEEQKEARGQVLEQSVDPAKGCGFGSRSR